MHFIALFEPIAIVSVDKFTIYVTGRSQNSDTMSK